MVWLHALGEQSSDWGPVAAALASPWRVYAPDLRGHGASDWPGSYTIEQLTMDLAAFLDALDLDHVVLGGHSVGGPPAPVRGTVPGPRQSARPGGSCAAAVSGFLGRPSR